MLSRGGRGKGLSFATKVLDSLLTKGVDATLRMSGDIPKGKQDTRGGRVEPMGWVSDDRKAELITESEHLEKYPKEEFKPNEYFKKVIITKVTPAFIVLKPTYPVKIKVITHINNI